MNKKEEFEARLSAIANAPVAFAGGDSPPHLSDWTDSDSEISEAVIQDELCKAWARLEQNPSLFCGDPDGVFTYDDPVLAIMAYLDQANSLMASVVGIAGATGEELRNATLWNWAKVAVHAWLSKGDGSYQTLAGMTPFEPITINQDVVRIAVIGDAGFQGHTQAQVINSIREHHRVAPFDLLIHLGDIYFAGSGGEMLHNFLAPFRSAGPRVLTLVGNHDLYFGGEAFADTLKDLQQPGRYFCVETPHWRVACLDTALDARELLRNTGSLDEGQQAWLGKLLEADDDKGTILMSHHYIVSGWEEPSVELRHQLAPHLKKIFAWYWGHEHGCATYDKKAEGFYGACVGNGAFLEVWKKPKREPLPDWYAGGRCSCYSQQSKFWQHGYLELELQSEQIIETYHLENGDSHERRLKRASEDSPARETL